MYLGVNSRKYFTKLKRQINIPNSKQHSSGFFYMEIFWGGLIVTFDF